MRYAGASDEFKARAASSGAISAVTFTGGRSSLHSLESSTFNLNPKPLHSLESSTSTAVKLCSHNLLNTHTVVASHKQVHGGCSSNRSRNRHRIGSGHLDPYSNLCGHQRERGNAGASQRTAAGSLFILCSVRVAHQMRVAFAWLCILLLI